MSRTGLLVLFVGCLFIVAVVIVRVGGMRNRSTTRQTQTTEKTETSANVDKSDRPTERTTPTPPEIKELPKVSVNAKEVEIPASLYPIFGMAEKKDYMTRIKAVHQLNRNLSEQEIKALYVFLNRHNNEDNLQASEVDAIKNDVSVAIMGQQTKPADYANNLMAMYYDKSHDNVWRDYCIQHLGGWYAKADAKEQHLIAATLWQAVEEKNLTISGTALIALSKNTGSQDIQEKAVANKAYEMCEDAQYGELAKITALQICAKFNEKKVLSTARKIAESGESVPLRMSAIAAIGTLGNSSDKPMLEKYAASSNVRLRKSAQGALARLEMAHF